MSEHTLLILLVAELAGLLLLFVLRRVFRKRQAEGKGRPPPVVRIFGALLGLALIAGLPVLMYLAVSGAITRPQNLRIELAKTGTRAVATITSVQETGSYYNRKPEVRVGLNVQPKDGPPFHGESTWVFTVSDVQSYRVGTKVLVAFDPKDRGRLVVMGLAPPDP